MNTLQYLCHQCFCAQSEPHLPPISRGDSPRLAGGFGPGSYGVTVFSLGSCMQEIASTLQKSFSVFPVLWNSYIKPFWHSGLMLEGLTWSQIPRLDSLTGCQTFKSWGITSLHMLSWVQLWVTPWTCQASLSITGSWSMLKLMSIESVMPSNHHILSCPSPPAFNLSQHQGLFMWVSSSHQVAKVLENQLQNQSFQGIFRLDFL